MKTSFDNGPEYEQAKIDRMVKITKPSGLLVSIPLVYELKSYTDEMNEAMKTITDIEHGEYALELWREFLSSHNNPFVVQEWWGEELQCYFCDSKGTHDPNCIYLRAKALIEEANE